MRPAEGAAVVVLDLQNKLDVVHERLRDVLVGEETREDRPDPLDSGARWLYQGELARELRPSGLPGSAKAPVLQDILDRIYRVVILLKVSHVERQLLDEIGKVLLRKPSWRNCPLPLAHLILLVVASEPGLPCCGQEIAEIKQ